MACPLQVAKLAQDHAEFAQICSPFSGCGGSGVSSPSGNDEVFVWGSNSSHQLAEGGVDKILAPKLASSFGSAQQVGTLQMWGTDSIISHVGIKISNRQTGYLDPMWKLKHADWTSILQYCALCKHCLIIKNNNKKINNNNNNLHTSFQTGL